MALDAALPPGSAIDAEKFKGGDGLKAMLKTSSPCSIRAEGSMRSSLLAHQRRIRRLRAGVERGNTRRGINVAVALVIALDGVLLGVTALRWVGIHVG